MKTKNLFATALFAVGVCVNLASCSNDAVEAVSEDCAIRLTTQVEPATRGTNTDLQSTQIIAGRQIGVTITGAKSEHNNVVWTAGADGALTNTGDPVYYGDGTVTIEAIHPYMTDDKFDGSGNLNVSVNTDQSTDENYLNSDFLYVKKSDVSKSNTPIPLTFKHYNVKINVTIENANGAEVWICGTRTSHNIPLAGVGAIPYFSSPTGNVEDIKAGETTADANTVTAIIISQQVAAGTKFIKVILNGKTYYYTLNSTATFGCGKCISYKLTLKGAELKLQSENIEPWDGGTTPSNVDATEEV